MDVKGGKQRTQPLPAPAAEAMQLEIQCDECDFRFAVIGSAFFCPACGHNSVIRMFLDSIRKMRAKKDNVQYIKNAMVEQAGKDEAELLARSLLESCVLDGVTAFQKYCEGVLRSMLNLHTTLFSVFRTVASYGKMQLTKNIQTG